MTELSGSSGYEDKVAQFVRKNFDEFCSDTTVDNHFNVVGLMPAKECGWEPPKVLICAHMDEVSLVVTKVEEGGFLRVASIGGVDVRLFPGMEVFVHGEKDLRGVIGIKPEEGGVIPMTDLMVDTGLDDASKVIHPGDLVTYDSELCSLKNSYVIGKAMDDRAGVAILLSAMRELKALENNANVYFAATCQEEVGTKGAQMVANRIQPDIGIAIDVTHATTPDAVAVGIDKGISITVGPNIHPTLVEKLMKTADENNLAYAVEVNPRPTGTDARSIQIAGEGAPTLLLSLPLKYMHTPNELIDIKTVDEAGKLLALFIASLKEDWKQWTNY